MKYLLLLFITPMAFGTSYVFCNIANNYLPPFTMNFIRYLLAAIFMLPFALKAKKDNLKQTIIGGLLLSLTIVSTGYIQQLCIDKLPSGKIGFIASLYVIMVPIANRIIFKKKVSMKVISSILLGLVGLVILCDVKNFSFSLPELGILTVAFIYIFNILWMDKYSKTCNSFLLLEFVFIFTVIFNLGLALTFESIVLENVPKALPSLLYLGFVCSCISYLAQSTAQRHVEPVIASVIMSFESVISVIAGAIVLNQALTLKELVGCAIMFASLLLCQYFSYKETQNL